MAEIILVDGYSTDDTIETARSLWPEIKIVHQTRRGKGNALACGFAAARSEIIVMIDADGSMDPGEIPYFVDALIDGADYAKGSRFTAGGGSSDITRFRAAGNHVLNALTGLVHRTAYTDLCYGFNAFWRRILPVLSLEAGEGGERRWGDGFEVETLINIRVHSAGLNVTEVPSFERERLHGASNLNAFADGWRVLSIIARESRALQSSKVEPAKLMEPATPEYSERRYPVVVGAPARQPIAIGAAFASAGEADNVIDFHAASELDRRAGEFAGAARA